MKWDPKGPPPPYGYFAPSNIVLASDGFRYALLLGSDPNGNGRMCVMRTQTLDDPMSWRAWDGAGFNLQMTSPYTGPAPALCGAVATNYVSQLTLTYNTYLGKYMVMGGTVQGGPLEPVCGFFYALSSDLITWSPLRLVREAHVPWFTQCLVSPSIAATYPSIIDHSDTTESFERSGQTPYLYYTRFNTQSLDRDLVRVPVTITVHP